MADPTTTEQVRLLIGDTDDTTELFTDAQVGTYLFITSGDVRRAAADALDTIASSEALLSKKIRTKDGLQTDGPAVAEALRAHATTLRELADRDDDADVFDVVDFVPYPLTAAEATEFPVFAWPFGS